MTDASNENNNNNGSNDNTADNKITGKKRYRVEYDREGCIGAAACAAIHPDGWKMADDGLADCLVYEFDEDELERQMEAAECCPVNVIHIIDTKTGEKLI